jgi:hypothetical protein
MYMDENMIGTRFDYENMTTEELDCQQDKIMNIKVKRIETRMSELEEKQKDLQNTQNRIGTIIDDIGKGQTEQKGRIDALEKETNVLCAPTHHKRRNHFKKKASARVKYLLGDKTTPEYMLFAAYFFKGIYHDIAYQLELGEWDDISMEDYDKYDSQYEQAKNIRDNWKPSVRYFKHCLDELIEKRDNTILSQDRCRALTIFLKATNNGEDVVFLK